MNCPGVSQVLSELLASGAISDDDADKYHNNYKYFEAQRPRIERNSAGRWVASFNGLLCDSDSLEELRRLINGEPGANRAYIEQVGNIV